MKDLLFLRLWWQLIPVLSCSIRQEFIATKSQFIHIHTERFIFKERETIPYRRHPVNAEFGYRLNSGICSNATRILSHQYQHSPDHHKKEAYGILKDNDIKAMYNQYEDQYKISDELYLPSLSLKCLNMIKG